MKILAIETSCDETAAAVIDGRTILSSVISSQINLHRLTGGIVPEVAARAQLETITPMIDYALNESGVTRNELAAIAVTEGPGLIGSLLIGTETAKALAVSWNLPLYAVNHLAGHLYACFPADHQWRFPWRFPYLGLLVSGAHTELVLLRDHNELELLGQTRDDAAGEAFDKVARLLDLPYPGGPEISRLAAAGDAAATDFPRPMLNQPNYDFSFSGLKTAVRQVVQAGERPPEDIAAGFQQAVIDTLVAKTLRAVAAYQPTAVLAGGGVAANALLRETLAQQLPASVRLLASPPELATDNAAMIGLAAPFVGRRLEGPDRLTLTADPSLGLTSTRAASTHSAK